METFNKVLELNYNNEFQFAQLIKYISLKNKNKTNKVYFSQKKNNNNKIYYCRISMQNL